MALRWFDGHLDLAYLAEQGRELGRDVADCGGAQQPAAVTFSSLARGNVRGTLATIFIQRRIGEAAARRQGEQPVAGPWCFDTLQEAGLAARRQLAIYERWEREGRIRLLTRKESAAAPLAVVLLMEGALGLERVEEFDEFYAAGVRLASLTWAEGSMWAGGDHYGGDVTPMGRELLHRMDELGVIHDVSHLSERAFWTVMERAKNLKIASHSNCRSLLPRAKYPERHLGDQQIQAIADQGGVIGLNLYMNFLVDAAENRRATIADIVRHVDHLQQVAGRAGGAFLCLGSDMDGGFSQEKLPADLTLPEHLERLAEALSGAGWRDADIEQFAGADGTSGLTCELSH